MRRVSLPVVVAAALVVVPFVAAFSIEFRRATPEDIFQARKTMFQEAMNPLSISQERLLVAYDDEVAGDPLVGFGQIRPLDGVYSELASLYVVPEYRMQGIGSSLVDSLLQAHDESDAASTAVCLLTLRSTTPLYEKYGFNVLDAGQVKSEMPSSLQFEYQAGSVISSFLGNDLVCMVRPTREEE